MNSNVLVVVAALAIAGTPAAAHAQLEEVSPGYDLFETDPGSTDLLGIPMEGSPLDPPSFDFVPPPASAAGTFPIGITDTIVHRLERASGDVGETDTIAIELVLLSLVSVDPVADMDPTVPDQHISVSLQKDRDPIGELRLDLDFDPPGATTVFPAGGSMGQMAITFADAGGTFDSSFLIFADARLEDGTIVCGGPLPACSPPACASLLDPIECANTDGCLFDGVACIDDPLGTSFETFDGGLSLSSDDSAWVREPLPGSIQIEGVNLFLAGPGDNSEDFWAGVELSVPALGPVAKLVLVLLLLGAVGLVAARLRGSPHETA